MNGEGVLDDQLEVQPLQWISPSRYWDLRQCALRELLLQSHVSELLPLAPAARLGIVIHRVLFEAATESQPRDLSWVARRIGELAAAEEAKMARNWRERHLVPLSYSVPQFALRIRQAESRAAELITSGGGSRPSRSAAQRAANELHVQTKDGRIRGVIDAVRRSSQGPVLVEFKTGWLYERGTEEVRFAYRMQLLLYAVAYWESSGEWPDQAELVSVTGAVLPFHLGMDEALEVASEARRLLEATNERLVAGARLESLASPSPAACGACRYRPACRAYRVARSGDAWPQDRWGELQELHRVRDGTAVAVLATSTGEARIRSLTLDAQRHPALTLSRSGLHSFFNLSLVGEAGFAQNPLTTVYVEPYSDPRGQ